MSIGLKRLLLAGGLLLMILGASTLSTHPLLKLGMQSPSAKSVQSGQHLKIQTSPAKVQDSRFPIAEPEAGNAKPLTEAEIYRTVSPAVVTIQAGNEIGSGSIVRADGMVLTNYHVVQQAGDRPLTVTLQTGVRYQGQVTAIDPQRDLALIQLNAETLLPTVRFGHAAQIQPQEPVYAIGSPYGRAGVMTEGTLLKILRNGDLLCQLVLQPGNSGGPLLNDRGELIGVNKEIWESSRGNNRGVSFGIRVDVVKKFVNRHLG